MSIQRMYRKIRKRLGIFAGMIGVIAFLLGFAFTNNGTEMLRASFAYNLDIVIVIAWTYASGFSKLSMVGNPRPYKALNILATLLLVTLLGVATQIPATTTPEPSSVLYTIWTLCVDLWFITWAGLDICEIAFVK